MDEVAVGGRQRACAEADQRAVHGVPAELFTQRTGLDASVIARRLALAAERGLLESDPRRIRPTRRGRLFLNDLLQLFLD